MEGVFIMVGKCGWDQTFVTLCAVLWYLFHLLTYLEGPKGYSTFYQVLDTFGDTKTIPSHV